MAETEHPLLVIEDENQPVLHWPLTKPEVLVGRVDDCDIVLTGRQVSRKHIRIYREKDTFYVQDLESKNGTWVNGEQLAGARELHDGDEIQVAMVARIQYVGSNSTMPLPIRVPVLEGGRLKLDRGSHRIFIRGEEISPPLSLPQYRLLELLYDHGGGICTRDTVVNTVWPDVESEGVSEQAIDALVRRLRDRLAEVDPEWQYIVTVRGHGFRLDNPNE